MKGYFILTILTCCVQAYGQIVADFESYTIQEESFLNGSDGSNGFCDNDILLPNEYDSAYGGFWSGWALSNITDNTSPGFLNQYSSIAGKGWNNSSNYAVSFVLDESRIILKNELQGKVVEGLYVTNGSYPYFSMKDGDAFAKRFGGIDGDDPDYFRLTVRKYFDGELSMDSLDFYLADFRFENNDLDYIVDDWQFFDLSTLGMVDSLSLKLSSSDNGVFGMNTPAYFCVDGIRVKENSTSADNIMTQVDVQIYPNPTKGEFRISNLDHDIQFIHVLDSSGNLKSCIEIINDFQSINLSDYPKGIYVLHIHMKSGIVAKKLIVI